MMSAGIQPTEAVVHGRPCRYSDSPRFGEMEVEWNRAALMSEFRKSAETNVSMRGAVWVLGA